MRAVTSGSASEVDVQEAVNAVQVLLRQFPMMSVTRLPTNCIVSDRSVSGNKRPSKQNPFTRKRVRGLSTNKEALLSSGEDTSSTFSLLS
jgi:hypothetical protein